MSREFYGPRAEAERAINELLKLPATGKEQDWEFEFSDPARIDEMLDVFASKDIDLECKSALALLIISSMEEADEIGVLDETQIRRARQLFVSNNEVQNRMSFYWIESGRASNADLVKRITNS